MTSKFTWGLKIHILFPPLIIVAGFVKLYKPVIKNEDKLLGGWLSGDLVNFWAPGFRIFELVGESYPQALLGELAFVFLCCL